MKIWLPSIHVAGESRHRNGYLEVGPHGLALFFDDGPAPFLDVNATVPQLHDVLAQLHAAVHERDAALS